MSAFAQPRRSKGVTVFGVLLILFGVFPIAILIKALLNPIYAVRPGGVAIYLAAAGMFIVLAIGILTLKTWARITCLWITCLWGVSIVSIGLNQGPALLNEPNDFVILGVLFYAFCIVTPVILLLSNRTVKKQFR